jgi:hypothetical protein
VAFKFRIDINTKGMNIVRKEDGGLSPGLFYHQEVKEM